MDQEIVKVSLLLLVSGLKNIVKFLPILWVQVYLQLKILTSKHKHLLLT